MSKKYQKLVLTGATGGIGEAIAKVLDEQGYELLLAGRNEDKLNKVLGKLRGTHQKLVADLTQPEGVNALRQAATAFGINGIINCLGTNELAMLEDMSSDQVSSILTTNLLAPISICKALIPLLENQAQGVILNVGSILGSIGYAGSSVYCASKFGLRGFTESLRRELSDTNVQVIYLAPRATNTALNSEAMNQMNSDLGNALDEPEYVAKQVLKALEKGRSANRYLGWPESFFVRLNSVFPVLVDKALSKQLAIIKRYCSANKIKKLSV